MHPQCVCVCVCFRRPELSYLFKNVGQFPTLSEPKTRYTGNLGLCLGRIAELSARRAGAGSGAEPLENSAEFLLRL